MPPTSNIHPDVLREIALYVREPSVTFDLGGPSEIMSTNENELVTSSDTAGSSASTGDPLAVLRTAPPLLVEPTTLVEGLRFLQSRIPDYTQLSADEVRAMMRAAYLDPEFIEVGIQSAGAWENSKAALGMSGGEMRAQADEIRKWDEVERELTVLLKGIAAANLKRKHHLGSTVLKLYNILRLTVDFQNSHLRPYFDAMKKAYLRRRKKAGKAAADAEPERPKD
jgi:hypothetical protein